MPIRSVGYARPPLGVPADLQSAVKKCPNLFMLWGICYPQQPGSSRHIDRIGGLQIPRLNRSNLFLRRIANPSGRLTGVERLTCTGTPSLG